MSYTNIFGGFNINTAFPSYASYTIEDNQTLQLTWASSFIDNTNITAQINDLTPESDETIVQLADATLISVGQTVQFNNVGNHSVTIKDFSGGEIAIIPPTDNNQYILYLKDNSTQAGTWGITHLGAGTSSADASVLAGNGTIALNSQINTNFPGKSINTNYQVLLSDRASIIVWTGGGGTITLTNQLDGFYIAVNNSGSGGVVVTTPDGKTIDGESSFSLNPSESSYFIGVDGKWNTLGFGVESFFQVNVLSPLDLSGVGSSITLTNQQASRLVQQYTGLLTQDVIVYYPAAAGQWYIWNNTTGAFNVTAQLAGPVGSSLVIPQGEKVILYSDGTSIYNTPTIATSVVFNDGSQGTPGISFISDTSTGFYKIPPAPAGVIGYSSSGTLSLTLGGANSGIGFGIHAGLPGVYWNTANTFYEGFKADPLLGSNLIFTLPSSFPTINGQLLTAQTSGVTSFSPYTINFPFNPKGIFYASSPTLIDTFASAANGVMVTDNSSNPSVSSSLPLAVQNNISSVGTITSGIWNASPINVPFGGTGINTTTPYGIICGGTTPTGNFQNVGSLGTAGQVLTSQGIGMLPNWQNVPTISAATIADQRAGTSTSVYVSPAAQQYHASAAKFWCKFDGTTVGTLPPISGFNVTSVESNNNGLYKINFTTPFLNINYVVSGMCNTTGTQSRSFVISAQQPNFFQFGVVNSSGTLTAQSSILIVGFGMQ